MTAAEWQVRADVAAHQIAQLRRATAWLKNFTGEGAQAARTAVLVRCCEVYAWGGWLAEARDLLEILWPVVEGCPVPVVQERARDLYARILAVQGGSELPVPTR